MWRLLFGWTFLTELALLRARLEPPFASGDNAALSELVKLLSLAIWGGLLKGYIHAAAFRFPPGPPCIG